MPKRAGQVRAPARGEVRDRVLETATRLFATRGYGATSLQAICGEIGISKAALLYHFSSKEELHTAVLDGVLAHWKLVLPRLLQAAADGEAMLDAILEELVEFFTVEPNRARLLLREALDREDELRARVEEHMQPWATLAAASIRTGQAKGTVRPDVDPEAFLVTTTAALLACVAAADLAGTIAPDDGEARSRALRELLRATRSSLFVDAN